MKQQTLVLWRHAQAHAALIGQSDVSRTLTPLGQQHALEVGAWLRAQLPMARVLASPAQRTQQTAAACSPHFETESVLAPDTSAAHVLQWLQSTLLLDLPCVLVSHQPTLGYVAAALLTGQTAPWALETGAAWCFSRPDPASQWQLRAVRSGFGLASI